eukprot:scaffold104294_cov69-Phaeocystis_antarctica.AAC.3
MAEEEVGHGEGEEHGQQRLHRHEELERRLVPVHAHEVLGEGGVEVAEGGARAHGDDQASEVRALRGTPEAEQPPERLGAAHDAQGGAQPVRRTRARLELRRLDGRVLPHAQRPYEARGGAGVAGEECRRQHVEAHPRELARARQPSALGEGRAHPCDEQPRRHRGDAQDRVEDSEGEGAVLRVGEAAHAQGEDRHPEGSPERQQCVERVDERPDQQADDGAEHAVEGVEDAGLDVGEAELVGEEGRVDVREGVVRRALGKLDREDDEEVARSIAELREAGLEALGLGWSVRGVAVDARIAAPAIALPAHPATAQTRWLSHSPQVWRCTLDPVTVGSVPRQTRRFSAEL